MARWLLLLFVLPAGLGGRCAAQPTVPKPVSHVEFQGFTNEVNNLARLIVEVITNVESIRLQTLEHGKNLAALRARVDAAEKTPPTAGTAIEAELSSSLRSFGARLALLTDNVNHLGKTGSELEISSQKMSNHLESLMADLDHKIAASESKSATEWKQLESNVGTLSNALAAGTAVGSKASFADAAVKMQLASIRNTLDGLEASARQWDSVKNALSAGDTENRLVRGKLEAQLRQSGEAVDKLSSRVKELETARPVPSAAPLLVGNVSWRWIVGLDLFILALLLWTWWWAGRRWRRLLASHRDIEARVDSAVVSEVAVRAALAEMENNLKTRPIPEPQRPASLSRFEERVSPRQMSILRELADYLIKNPTILNTPRMPDTPTPIAAAPDVSAPAPASVGSAAVPKPPMTQVLPVRQSIGRCFQEFCSGQVDEFRMDQFTSKLRKFVPGSQLYLAYLGTGFTELSFTDSQVSSQQRFWRVKASGENYVLPRPVRPDRFDGLDGFDYPDGRLPSPESLSYCLPGLITKREGGWELTQPGVVEARPEPPESEQSGSAAVPGPP